MAEQRREYSRIPIPTDQADTVLIARGNRLPVRLIDAAPFGFAFACPNTLKVGRGDHLQLFIPPEWVEVRVVRAEPLDKELFVGVARVRGLGAIPPNERWLVALGGHVGLWMLVFALAAGILGGAYYVVNSEHMWKRLQSAVSAVPLAW